MATDLAVKDIIFKRKPAQGPAAFGSRLSQSPLLFLLELRSAFRTVKHDLCAGFVNRRILRLREGEVGCQYLCSSSARSHAFLEEPGNV